MLDLSKYNTHTLKYGFNTIRTIYHDGEMFVVGNDVLTTLNLNAHLIISSFTNDEIYPMESGLKLVETDDPRYRLILLDAKGLFKIINLNNSTKLRRFEKWADEYLFPLLEMVAA